MRTRGILKVEEVVMVIPVGKTKSVPAYCRALWHLSNGLLLFWLLIYSHVALATTEWQIKAIDAQANLVMENGDIVVLYGIFMSDSMSASGYLQQQWVGKTVQVETVKPERDRYNRIEGWVSSDAGELAQVSLLRQGLAQIDVTRSLPPDKAAMMAAAEQVKIFPVTTGMADLPAYATLEGEVVAVAKQSERVLLNFGADWRSDFTVVIPRKMWRRLEKVGVDVAGLTGRKIRVRGWVYHYNGAAIDITTPQQIEVLPE